MATCYASRGDDSNGNLLIQADGVQTPCGGSKTNVTSCCISGHRCTENAICHFPDPSDKTSGYYIGGCTDQTFNDPACSRACIHYNQHDIIYNSTSQLWSCCWNSNSNSIDCPNPTSQTFQADARDALSDAPAYTPVPVSSSSASSASTSITTSSSPSAPPAVAASAPPPSTSSIQSTSSGGLSTGSQAGIGVGCAIVGLIVIAALAFLIMKRRRKSGEQRQGDWDGGAVPQEKDYTEPPVMRGELDGTRSSELDGVPRSEMEAHTEHAR